MDYLGGGGGGGGGAGPPLVLLLPTPMINMQECTGDEAKNTLKHFPYLYSNVVEFMQ